MTSREKILSAVKSAQPEFVELPNVRQSPPGASEASAEMEGWRRVQQTSTEAHPTPATGVSTFIQTLTAIGGHAKAVSTHDQIIQSIQHQFPDATRIVSTIPELQPIAEIYSNTDTITSAENIDVAILTAHFGVAENGAVYLTEDIICDRVLPFICQHLVVILKADTIVSNMYEAYDKIANNDYGYAIFVAGPSKTADIEQSLVLGAHGPISMTVLILE